MYARPHQLEEALMLLPRQPWVVLAGGTDFYPGLQDRPVKDPVLDISRVEGLSGIDRRDGVWRIGCLATWNDLIKAPLPPAFDALKQAAREVGSVQIQNRATIAGNLCNASPAADGVPPLLILDAEIELRSHRGTRVLALSDFILGNRKTSRQADELVTAILIPSASVSGQSDFVKLGARKYLVISIAMVAARLAVGPNNTIIDAAVSAGACSETAQRLSDLERELIGRPADHTVHDVLRREHLVQLSPIDDIRSSAAYRNDAALELIARALKACCRPGVRHG